MDQRHLIFIAGLLLLMFLVGYVRDLGIKAGFSPQAVALLEKLAIFAG
jgi:hypothetical protein